MVYDLGQLGIVSGAYDLTRWTLDVLKLWLPQAAHDVNAAGYTASDGGMIPPMTYGRIPLSVMEQNADQVPAVYVSSPGTTGSPVITGNDAAIANWYTFSVTVIDRGQTWEETADRAQIWASLVRAVILGNPTLRGNVTRIAFVSEAYAPIPADQGRTFAGATVTFRALMPSTIRGTIGPLTTDPSPDPSTGDVPGLPDAPQVITFEGTYTDDTP